MRWAAAAAVVGFVAVLAAWRVGGPAPEPSIEQLIVDFRAAETEYVRATNLLAQRLDERRADIEPDLLAVLDANLAQIDAAIAEVHVALDPERADVENQQMLTALYDKKLKILWRASRLSS
jgi:hypothetical protein